MAGLTYSAVVRGLKVVLPLVALALLSTLFLVARSGPQDSTLPFIEEFRDRAATDGDSVRTPFYTGTTDAGDAVTVRADLVRPDESDPNSAAAERLRADLRYEDGSLLRVDADRGRFTGSANLLDLEGDVVLRSSTGYELTTAALALNLDAGTAQSPVAVRAIGPPGTIDAGGMVVRRLSDEAVELVFTNGVKVVYMPPRRVE